MFKKKKEKKKTQTPFKCINLIIKNKTIDQLISDGLPYPQEDNVFGLRQKSDIVQQELWDCSFAGRTLIGPLCRCRAAPSERPALRIGEAVIWQVISLADASEAAEQQINSGADGGADVLLSLAPQRVHLHQVHRRQQTCRETKSRFVVNSWLFVGECGTWG